MARNPRAAAQRATARAVRERRTQLPSQVTSRAIATRTDYLQGVLDGRIAQPTDTRSLARAAGKASWGKADPRYEAAWAKFWYHVKENYTPGEGYNPDEEETREESEDEEE
jgi:hypothetical protein